MTGRLMALMLLLSCSFHTAVAFGDDAKDDVTSGIVETLGELGVSVSQYREAEGGVKVAFTHGSRIFSKEMDLVLQLEHVTRVDIEAAQISPDGFARVAELAELRQLFVWDTRLSSRDIAALKRHPSLEFIDFEDVVLDGKFLEALATIENLKDLRFRNVDLACESFQPLTKRSLLQLEMVHCGIDDADIEVISHISSLQYLNIAESKGVTDRSLEWLRSMPHLDDIDIRYTSMNYRKTREQLYLHPLHNSVLVLGTDDVQAPPTAVDMPLAPKPFANKDSRCTPAPTHRRDSLRTGVSKNRRRLFRPLRILCHSRQRSSCAEVKSTHCRESYHRP